MKISSILIFLFLTGHYLQAQVYIPDLGNGSYQNPIIHADYSDPDVIRVGDDFFMVASSFNCVPGLPVLHSRDLVNWTIINHALPTLSPEETFNRPQHGNGVWAPAIRFYAGWYYIYYGDPDFGIYMIRAKDPRGAWEKPVLVKSAKGWIDPCPFWDEDGRAYLVHAFAGSRAGIKSILVMHSMSKDGTQLLDDGVIVFDGHQDHPTIEGPKMYKRNGYYYIFAPGGGVAQGWQTVLRAKNIYGPYEDRIVLTKGQTDINGPHQGAWVELKNGESWFVHFQEKQPYGRIVHLQPARWQDDWIVMGEDKDGEGTGEPVLQWKKPNVDAEYSIQIPQTSDEFNQPRLGRQWQWQGNPQPGWIFPSNLGFLRINPVVVDSNRRNLWHLPNLLLQKMPAESFTATTKLTFHHQNDSEEVGLLIMGRDYAYLSLLRESTQLVLRMAECKEAEKGTVEKEHLSIPMEKNTVFLRVKVEAGGLCQFSYSTDNETFVNAGPVFTAREGKWIGAKAGLFSIRHRHINDGGYTNIDWFRFSN